MRKGYFFLCFLGFLTISFASFSQKVEWGFTASRIKDSLYEVKLTATIMSSDWFIYAQKQDEGGVSQATAITFTKNPLIQLSGGITEQGTQLRKHYKVLDYTARIYKEKVTFVQMAILKAKAKTALGGELIYQTCNDHVCMPPATIKFSIPIDPAS